MPLELALLNCELLVHLLPLVGVFAHQAMIMVVSTPEAPFPMTSLDGLGIRLVRAPLQR